MHTSKTNTGNHNNYLKTRPLSKLNLPRPLFTKEGRSPPFSKGDLGGFVKKHSKLLLLIGFRKRSTAYLSSKKALQGTALKKTLIASSMLSMFCLLSQITYAQSNANHESNNNDIPTARLETIVITATKTDKSLSDSPIPINVISKTTLEDNQPRTLKEAIQLLPNVTLQQVHGKSGYEVKMQGMSSEQVLVLIDGLPITASTGSTVNLNQYLNVEVEQIEVIQGASSAQYGSSAMGGVINVITKKLDAQKAPLSGRASVELASNGEQNPSAHSVTANRTYVDASVDIRLDKAGHWQARLSGSRLTDDGLSLEPKKWARLKDKSEQTQASASRRR